MPLDPFDGLNEMDALLEQEIRHALAHSVNAFGVPVDLYALYDDDIEETWLVDDVWPLGRQLHIHAARKTGKSLVALWMAANLAVGRDPFTLRPREAIRVAYLDYEMTLTDLKQRLFDDMDFKPDQFGGRLHYYLHPAIPALDTASGGESLMRGVLANEYKAVILDTMSRVIQGEENSNDTYLNFFRHTGLPLKESGVSLARLDHEGHEGGRSRGASAKADDVDIVWQLKEADYGLTLVRKASRVADVPESVSIHKTEEPLAFKRSPMLWPQGTIEKAAELDELGASADISQRQARMLFKEANRQAGKQAILTSALAYRRSRQIWP